MIQINGFFFIEFLGNRIKSVLSTDQEKKKKATISQQQEQKTTSTHQTQICLKCSYLFIDSISDSLSTALGNFDA